MLSLQEKIHRAKILEDRIDELLGINQSSDSTVGANTDSLSMLLDTIEAEVIDLYRDAGKPWTPLEESVSADQIQFLVEFHPGWKAHYLTGRLRDLGQIRLEWINEMSFRSLSEEGCRDESDFLIDPPIDPEAAVDFLQHCWFQVDFACRLKWDKFTHLTELRSLIAHAITARFHKPDETFNDKIWNRARHFNSDRVLDLTIKSLVWNVMDPRAPVQVECGAWEKALAHEETRMSRSGQSLPQHPTLKAPWRVMQKTQEGLWHESALGASIEDAWEQFLNNMAEIMSWGGEPEALDFTLLRQHLNQYESGAVFQVSSGLPEHWLTEYRIMQDHADLDVVGSNELVTLPTREGLKAREIWFQRFASVIQEALPAPVMTLRFAMEQQAPKNPRRTFFARFDPTQLSDIPCCCECGELCRLAAYFSFRHHSLPCALPGEGLLLFTCGDQEDCHRYDDSHWHKVWLKDAEDVKQTTIPLLAASSEMYSGPAMWVKEYDFERVDESLFDKTSPMWNAYNDSWEKSRFCFATPGTKIGGAASTIQGAVQQRDQEGNPLYFIAQIDHDFFEMGDSGRAYFLFSPETGEIFVETDSF